MKTLATLVVLSAGLPALADPSPPVQAAIRQLADGSEEEKVRAVRALKDMGPAAVPAIPALADALKEGPPPGRVEIAKLLGALGPAATDAIPALVAIVYEPRVDSNLFAEAANAVAALGDAGNLDVVRACLAYEFQGRGGRRVGGTYPDYLARHAAATAPVIADLLADPAALIRFRAALTLAVLAAPAQGKPAALAAVPPAARTSTAAALRKALDDPDLRTRACAASALLDLDPTALPVAAPALLSWGRVGDSHTPECVALVRAGTPAARWLVERLDDPEGRTRRAVLAYLSQFGDGALPALADGLRHPTPRVREGTVRALAYGKRAARLRTGLTARLRDPDPDVRVAAATVLAAADCARADAAVPVLAEYIFDRDPFRRMEALASLRELGPVARPAVPDLLRRLRSGDLETRLVAAEALMDADRSTWRSYVPALAAVVRANEPGTRQRALTRLRNTGPDARAALPALKDCLRVDDPLTRILAAEAVARVAPDAAAEAAAALVAVLKEPLNGGRRNNRNWRLAVRALDRIGPAARDAVPYLVELIRLDPEHGVAPEAAVVALKLDPFAAAELYEIFRLHLRPNYPDLDEQWLYATTRLQKLAKPLVPDLVLALQSKNSDQRDTAFDALSALGPDARDALPTLREIAASRAPDASRAVAAIKAIEKN